MCFGHAAAYHRTNTSTSSKPLHQLASTASWLWFACDWLASGFSCVFQALPFLALQVAWHLLPVMACTNVGAPVSLS
jgi:hypothetical protein